MTKEIKLFINNQEVEFSSSPDILFTFQVDELTNPTVVKNSYSKTVVIPGTKQNNKIFDGIWNVERIQDILTFNPSKKAPFTIYNNGEIYQTGYAKLIDITTNDNKIEYNVSLFGGLGDFFYSLMYSSSDDVGESEKRKLSDLYYGTNASATTSADEFDFQINKNTVQEAWSQLSASTSGSMWNTINFAPLYNGLADGFDSDKVLINTQGNTKIKRTFVSGGTTYSTYENYVLAELKNNYTEWQMRDLRSYLQRPVIRVKDIIGAICKPENNGGYEVELDSEFFSSGNPYYWKSWMTLPMLSNLDYDTTKESASGTASMGSTTQTYPSGYKYVQQENINVSGMPEDAKSYNVSVDVDIQAILDSAYTSSLVTGSTSTAETNTIDVTSYDNYGTNYPSAIAVQLVAYDSNGRVCGGSDNIWITGVYRHTNSSGSGSGRGGTRPETGSIIPSMADLGFTPVYSGANTSQLIAHFDYVGDNKTRWQISSGVSLTIKNVKKAWNVKLVLSKVNNSPSAQAHDYYSRVLFQPYYMYNGVLRHRITLMDKFNVVLNGAEVTFNSNEAIRSGSKFKKAQLLNTDYTPADWLLSYAKQFGLYFSKDKDTNKIYIRTRKSFYDDSKVLDLDKLIDNSKQRTINPIVFDAKWYNWQLEQENSSFSKIYNDTYGVKYGSQKVNTGYNFDGNDNDLLKGNIFKGAVECLERSDMYSYISGDTTEKPWQYQGYSYNLYSNTNIEDSTEITVSASTRMNKLKSFQPLKFYDLFSKVQLHDDDNKPSDGSRILLFFDSFVPTKSKVNGDDVNYWLTDDNNAMAVLNEDTPCWLYTVTNTSEATLLSSIPHFGRYLINDGENVITSSWDFGNTRQLYIPDVYTSANSTIYSQYWKRYISDLYDIDTKKLTCYVTFKGKPTEEWLRYFYWFENCLWRINKIIDHNVTSNDSTKVEFIKVQDITNYTVDDYQPLSNLHIAFSSGSTSTTVPNSGGTVRVFVTTIDQSLSWFVSDSTLDYASPTRGTGNGYFDITLPANTGDDSKVFNVAVEGGDDSWSNTITITQGSSVLRGEFQQPWKSRNIYTSGETADLTITSTYPWSITVDRTYVTLSASGGTGNTQYGETIYATWSESDSMAFRSAKFTVTDSQGNVIYIYKNQDGLTTKGLFYQNSGGTQIVTYASGKAFIVPDWVSVTDNGDNTYSVEALPNTKGERTATLAFQGDDGVEIYYVGVEQEAGSAVLGEFDITPKVWFYADSGGTQVLNIVNPSGKTWEFHNVPDWITVQYSGTTEGNINVVANQNGITKRESVIIFYNRTDDETIALYCKQEPFVPYLTLTPETVWFDTSGGTAIINVNSNVDWNIHVSGETQVTGISLDNLTWVDDIPASGGTASSANCSFTVTAYGSDGTTGDVTTFAEITGDLVVSASTAETRHSAGTLELTATYSGFTASASTTVYQEESVNPYKEYLTFEIVSGGTLYWKTTNRNASQTIQYSKDSGSTWTSISSTTAGTQISVSTGDVVLFKGDNSTYGPSGIVGSRYFSASTGTQFKLKGNIMSLISSTNFESATTLPTYSTFYGLFKGCGALTDISELLLPATTLAVDCYVYMFAGCTGLTSAANLVLPATSLTNGCYDSMFSGCTGLVSAPELPATTIANNCYRNMFKGCTSLTTAPSILPATALTTECYQYMFQYCSSLISAPELPATVLANYCYNNMFLGCSSLTTAPELPANTLVESCYENMFYDCTSLNYIKCLATDISAGWCTDYWVNGVSANGTFVKDASMTSWTTGDDGIPSGWTVQDNS